MASSIAGRFQRATPSVIARWRSALPWVSGSAARAGYSSTGAAMRKRRPKLNSPKRFSMRL